MKISPVFLLTVWLCLSGVFFARSFGDESEDQQEEINQEEEDVSKVTCGSVIKLKHVPTNVRLHSHQVSYGSGSKQQSVTGFPGIDDPNSFWIVKGAFGKHCTRGNTIKNGDVIRLEHLATHKHLHSHLHPSPLTNQQEVSAYGAEEGAGDTGDNWKVITLGSDVWKRGESVRLQHVDTEKYLSSNTKKFGNPIPGQQEVACIAKESKDTEWAAEEGYFFGVTN